MPSSASVIEAGPDVPAFLLEHCLALQRDHHSFGLLLQLPTNDEREFWLSSETRDRLLANDRWGVATGLVINFALGWFFSGDHQRSSCLSYAKYFPLVALALQIIQASWLCIPKYRESYLRARHNLTLIQRTQRIMQNLVAVFFIPPHDWMHVTRAGDDTWRTFLCLVFLNPMTAFLNAINHALPTKHQLAFITAKAVLDLTCILPQWIAISKSFNFDAHATDFCHQIESSFVLIAGIVSPIPDPRPCDYYATEFVFCFVSILLSVIIPLHLTYWFELQCKAEFVESKIVPRDVPREIKLRPAVRPAAVMMSLVASIASCWALCSIWASRQANLAV